jgi:hypothetical protein
VIGHQENEHPTQAGDQPPEVREIRSRADIHTSVFLWAQTRTIARRQIE